MRIFIVSVIAVLVALVSQAEVFASSNKTHSLQIAKRTEKQISILSPRGVEARDFRVHVADASFIKLHFKNFQLPLGMEIEISNPDGSESYRYSRNMKGPLTFDESAGDDGKNSFSAMSISGDTAIIRVVGELRRGFRKSRKQRVIVDYFVQGFPVADPWSVYSKLDSAGSKSKSGSSTESSDSGFFHIQNSCGVNEKFDTICWAGSNPTEYDRSRPVAKLIVGTKTCTAWRAGPDNRMFTNNHCMLDKNEASRAEVWFNYESSVCGGIETEQVIKVSVDQLLSTDYTLDYSLFSVNNFSSIESFGNLGIETREVIQGERIYIPQHSSGLPKQLAIESDMDMDGMCQIADNNLNGRGDGTDVGYYCDTASGSSGSPVLSAENNKVIALNHSTAGICMNGGVKMSLIWKKVSRHFGRVVPEGDGGVPPPPPEPEPNTNPVAGFSYACVQLSCSFDGSSSSDSDGSVVAYSWNFGDSNNGSGASINHMFASEGTYTVTLTVQDDAGGNDSTSKTLSVVNASIPPSPINLSGTSNKQKGSNLVNLSWSGTESSLVEIYRNDLLLLITANDGAFTDTGLGKRETSATYKVCEQGLGLCSNEITLNF